MTNDYDLIVIGNSKAGVYAALAAAQLKARVALIEPQNRQGNWLGQNQLYHQVLLHLGQVIKQVCYAKNLGIHPYSKGFNPNACELEKEVFKSTDELIKKDLSEFAWHIGKIEKDNINLSLNSLELTHQFPEIKITEAIAWAERVVSTCAEITSPGFLASMGVDLIAGDGEFCRLPHLAFVVNNRHLQARAYLIATGSCPQITAIDGLEAIYYHTPKNIWTYIGKYLPKVKPRDNRTNLTDTVSEAIGKVTQMTALEEREKSPKIYPFQLPKTWLVFGSTPQSVELAQTLAWLGCQVTLAVSESHILPQEDLEVCCLIQAQLEAAGIRIFTQSPVTQIRLIEGKKWVQVGNRAIEIDEILLGTGQRPNIDSLNLEGVGVKFSPKGLKVNAKLQTTNSRIYACGDVLGGYPFEHIGQYEASIALKNALFFPRWTVNYQDIPWAIFTDPPLARVGLTEVQAKRYYGPKVCAVRHYFKILDKAQILGETTGFCKLLVRPNGVILGGLILGAGADELISAIALLMRHKIKLGSLAKIPQVSPTISEMLYQVAQEWQRQRLENNQMLQNLLEGFFYWRRKW